MNLGDDILQSILDAVPAPIFYKDAALVYRGCNKAFEDFLGLSREKILGQTVYGISPGNLAEIYHRADEELFHQGGVQNYEADVKFADGTLRKVEFRKSAINDPKTSTPTGLIGVILDVTKLRAAKTELILARDQAEAANHSKSRLLANISHELRTPLNAILGFSQIINDEMFGAIDEKRYVEYAGDIVRSGKSLLGLIDDVLDLSRIEANQSALVIEPVNLIALVGQCVRDVGIGSNTQHGITINTILSADLPDISTDGGRLGQVLLNLITNAVKYGKPGGSVTISAEQIASTLVLQVADDGIGIGGEMLETVFEPFMRINDDIGRRVPGHGLGLPIAKALMAQLGGNLKLESIIHEGTTATLTLPLDPSRH